MTRIDTVDQLDALPIGSVILSEQGGVFERQGVTYWRETGFTWQPTPSDIALPVTLLFVPGRDLVQEARADAWDECSRTAHLQDHEPYCAPNPYRDEAP